ncbi:MAG: Holliday junction branch migration protein RuvA [Gemmataceae bacterium]
MLTKMTGTLARVLDDEARLTVGPFEYQVLLPESVRRQVQMRTGQDVTFHLIEYLEGGPSGNRFVPRRIGFLSESEREFFELLCTVEKIGVKKALRAMSRPVREIADAINRQDSRWLSTLPGIGAAMAETVVTSLKRKVTKFLMGPTPAPTLVDAPPEAESAPPSKAGKKKAAAEPAPASVLPEGNLVDDVYQALMSLGHNAVDARAKLDALLAGGKPFKTLDEALLLVYGRG